LVISQPSGCGACAGTAEGAPACQPDGASAASDPNGGCGGTPAAFPQTVTLGQTICGQANYYTTSGSGFRDLDFYLFTPATSGNYRINICSDFPSAAGFFRNYTASVTGCQQCTNALGGVTNAAALTPTSVDRNLEGGVTYAIFIAPQQGLGTLACSNYRFSVTSLGVCAWTAPPGSVAGTLDTTCWSTPPAPDPDGGCNITPTAFNPITVNGPAVTGILSTFISGANCGREFDWYEFVAPSTGTFTVVIGSETGVVFQAYTGSNGPGLACGTLTIVNTTGTLLNCGTVTTAAIPMTSGTRYSFLIGQASFYGQPCLPGNVGNRYYVEVNSP
jgi:hypothetical protein